MGGAHWVKGGTGKAEAAKLPDAGISLKPCPENEWQKKGLPAEQETIGVIWPCYVGS